jgi:hypothetical protein
MLLQTNPTTELDAVLAEMSGFAAKFGLSKP